MNNYNSVVMLLLVSKKMTLKLLVVKFYLDNKSKLSTDGTRTYNKIFYFPVKK